MGNNGSSSTAAAAAGNGRRRNQSHNHNAPEMGGGNRYIFGAAMPYAQYPNPNSPQYYNYAPPPTPSAQLPAPLDNRHQGWRHPYYPAAAAAARVPFVEHQKAVTIRNDVNLKKESLVIEKDEENPGRYLVAFTFDAAVEGSITVLFFAKESFACNLEPMKETLLAPVTVTFKIGLGQKFKQPPGTGIDISMLEEFESMKEGETEVYPLAIKAESWATNKEECGENKSMVSPSTQITQAVFEKKENGEYQVRVVKQMLWVNGMQYELQEIYGIGNSVDGDFDGSDPGKECVVCLSEVRDTTVLPCRHMCLCSECAKVLRFQTNRCPVCRQPVDRLLEIMVNDGDQDHLQAPHC